MKLEINKIYGTSSNHQLNFDVSKNYIAYIASGGVIVSNIDPLTRKLINQRFFCANASLSINNTTSSGSGSGTSSANAYLNLYVNNNNNGFPRECDELDGFGFPKSNQPFVINPSGSTLANSLNELKLSPKKTSNSPAAQSLAQSSNSNNHFNSQNKIQQISSIAISPDEKLLAVGESGTNPRILIFSLAMDSLKCPMITINEHSFGIQCLRFSKDSKNLISFGDEHDGFVYVWRLQGASTRILALNKNSIKLNGCLWDYDSGFVFSYGLRSIKIWRFEENQNSEQQQATVTAVTGINRREKIQVRNLILGDHLNANFVSMVKHQQTGNYIVLTDKDELLELNMDSNTLTPLKNKLFHTSAMAILNNQLYWNQDLNVSCLDTALLQHGQLESASSPSSTTATSNDSANSIISMRSYGNDLLVYLTNTEEIKLHDTTTGTTSDLIWKANAQGLKKTLDGLYTWNKAGEIRRFEDGALLQTVTLEEESKLAPNSIISLDSTTSHELIVGDAYGNLMFYDHEGNLKDSLKLHEFSVNDLRYFQLHCKEFIISIGRDRTIQVLYRKTQKRSGEEEGPNDCSSWKLLQTLSIHKSNVTSLVIHQDQVITGSTDRTVAIHRITKENKIELVKIITLKFTPLCIAVYDDELMVSLLDKSVQIYDFERLELKKTHKFELNMDNIVKSQGFLIASSANRSLQVIDPKNGSCVFRTWGHSDTVRKLVLTDEGSKLISLSQGCLFEWSLDTTDDLELQSSSTTPIINRKALRKESPVRVTPSKIQLTPSKLSSTTKVPTLTPLERRISSNSVAAGSSSYYSASSSPAGGDGNSPSLRSRSPGFSSPLRSFERISNTSSPSTFRNNPSSSRTRTNSTNVLSSNQRSSKSISSVLTTGKKISTARPNGNMSSTCHANSPISNKENVERDMNGKHLCEIEQVLSLLRHIKLKQDDYSVGEMKRLKEGVKFLFDDEAALLSKYNDLLMSTLQEFYSSKNS